ncbi:Acetyltransferase [Mycoplasmopsis agalactiae 14628]|uniref:Acetyltransferase n=1 Tax=Mycoplasmopsis agalactiae 14628 TaxID=1110504 RepID=I5D6L0_MYCAA|nr:GNAT family N-acetyltransferase [Mycoplasmopsis agalactiae]EIN15319.1 Acetyltransferase [Mycoplasmopsis agalactiae 14628]
MLKLQKAIAKDLDDIFSFLNNDKLLNFFFIGDIKTFGLDAKFMPVFVHKDENDKVNCVILIYYETLLIYDPFNLITTEQLEIIVKEHNIRTINISDKIFSHYASYFEKNSKIYEVNHQELAYCDKSINDLDLSEVKMAMYDDLAPIVESRMQIDEFKSLVSSYQKELESYQNSYKKGILSPFIIKEDNKVVANALVAIKTDDSVLIGGVYCLNEYRNKGYATKAVAALTNHIINNEKKTAMLFYHNPAAGRIYHRIGFIPCGNLYTISVVK